MTKETTKESDLAESYAGDSILLKNYLQREKRKLEHSGVHYDEKWLRRVYHAVYEQKNTISKK